MINLLKILSALAIIFYIFEKYDFLNFISQTPLTPFFAALVTSTMLLSVQVYLNSHRIKLILSSLNRDISIKRCWEICQHGGLYAHSPISFIGGDFVRAAMLKSDNVSALHSASVVLVDRLMGFFVLSFLTVISSYSLHILRGTLGTVSILITAICLFVILLILLFAPSLLIIIFKENTKLREILIDIHILIFNQRRRFFQILTISFFMYLLGFMSTWLIAYIFSFKISLMEVMITSPLILMLTMLPISFAGWGIREAATIYFFGMFSVVENQSIIVSVIYGLAVFLTYSPAVIMVLLKRR